jgi:hypothetical protein
MISLEERLQELEEPPGAELLDMDAVLREIGYEVTAGRSYRAYHHKGWNSTWTLKTDWRLVPLALARQIVSFLRLKLNQE